jgi:hypothetical protein
MAISADELKFSAAFTTKRGTIAHLVSIWARCHSIASMS